MCNLQNLLTDISIFERNNKGVSTDSQLVHKTYGLTQRICPFSLGDIKNRNFRSFP
jgi:hypothetical protein